MSNTELNDEELQSEAEVESKKTKTGRPVVNIRIVYHEHCVDGWTAAWAAKQGILSQALEASVKPMIHFIGMTYKNRDEKCLDLLHILQDSPEEEHVVVVDFSFTHKYINLIRAEVCSLLILDHHKSAQQDLADLPEPLPCTVFDHQGVYAIFDMNQSGAGLAWRFLNCDIHSKRPWQQFYTPEIIQLVEDRDLWRHENDPDYVDKCRPVFLHLGIISEYENMEQYHWYLDMHDSIDNSSIDALGRELILKGATVYNYETRIIKEVLQNHQLGTILVSTSEDESEGLKHIDCGIIYAPYSLTSRACHELLDQCPGIKLAINIVPGPHSVSVSFRSRKTDDIDCSFIARQFNGGGHAQAAGGVVKHIRELCFNDFGPKVLEDHDTPVKEFKPETGASYASGIDEPEKK